MHKPKIPTLSTAARYGVVAAIFHAITGAVLVAYGWPGLYIALITSMLGWMALNVAMLDVRGAAYDRGVALGKEMGATDERIAAHDAVRRAESVLEQALQHATPETD